MSNSYGGPTLGRTRYAGRRGVGTMMSARLGEGHPVGLNTWMPACERALDARNRACRCRDCSSIPWNMVAMRRCGPRRCTFRSARFAVDAMVSAGMMPTRTNLT